VWLLIGSFIIALSFNWFLNPNQVASGGVSGLSTILNHSYGWEPAIVQWCLNIPLFAAGVFFLGGRFGLKTAVGSIVLPLFILLTREFEPLTTNVLLAAIYGGIGVGLGLGFVFRSKASTGGTDVAAQLIHRFTGLSFGKSIAIMDGLVIVAAGLAFDAERALYALIALFVTSKTIDIVQVGFSNSKMAYIISERSEELCKVIIYDLNRGLTKLPAQGGYTGSDRTILMVVVNQRELAKLKGLVRSVDPHAFIIVSDAAEVLGEGFQNHS
jgi:uncharacterized membrane-anchored protein YitT (DUF2179 family)